MIHGFEKNILWKGKNEGKSKGSNFLYHRKKGLESANTQAASKSSVYLESYQYEPLDKQINPLNSIKGKL